VYQYRPGNNNGPTFVELFVFEIAAEQTLMLYYFMTGCDTNELLTDLQNGELVTQFMILVDGKLF
jgi:hypothetical protein